MADMRDMQRRSQACADFGDALLDSIEQNVGEPLERYAVAIVVYEREAHGACSLAARWQTMGEREKLCQVLDGCLQLFAGELEAPISKIDIREVEPGS
jgi:metal-responsive CopG/Arc/MetJ family transcriptional regulator